MIKKIILTTVPCASPNNGLRSSSSDISEDNQTLE